MIKRSFLVFVSLIFAVSLSAEELKSIQLPAPQLDTGKTVMQALMERKSSRSFSVKKLPIKILSNMLWAACGINRPDSGHHTSPSAMNWQEIDVYVATSEGLFLYVEKGHSLKPVLNQDIRSLTGKQPFVSEAPVDLIYVADYSKMGGANAEERIFYSAADTGFISENVYLYCASEGLATVVRGLIDREALADAMKLRINQKIILAQTVGYPAGTKADTGPGVFNLNKATYDQLKMCPFLGETFARKIIDYRFAHGPYDTINSLFKVRGVTWKLIDQIKPYLVLEGDTTFDLTTLKNTGS
jgi:DNA uptake protein ComE-like DNA-binding protein